MRITERDRERFERNTYPDPNSGCFIWAGAEKGNGYGTFYIDHRMQSAHRVALAMIGQIPRQGEVVLHSCDCRCCVNPDHLRIGTHAENNRDMALRGRGRKGQTALPAYVWRSKGRYGYTIGSRGRRLCKGGFASPGDAAEAALVARRQYYA